MKVLIIEDDPILRDLFEKELEFLGHAVEAFPNGEQGLERYQSSYYPLVMLDLGLPGISGLDVCKGIRELPWGKESLVLIITGNDSMEDVQKALDVGADDYLIKPVKRKELEVRLMIFERQIAQRVRHRQCQRFIDHAPDPILTFEAQTGEIMDVNATGCQALRYLRSELLEKTFQDILSPSSDLPPWNELVGTITQEQKLLQAASLKCKDGNVLAAEIHFGLSSYNNRNYIVAVIRETSHRW